LLAPAQLRDEFRFVSGRWRGTAAAHGQSQREYTGKKMDFFHARV
jgi:hypothetical protein